IGERTLEKHLPDPAHRRIYRADIDIACAPDEVCDTFAGERNTRIEQQQFKKTALLWPQRPLPERLPTPWAGPYSQRPTFGCAQRQCVSLKFPRAGLPIEAQRVASPPDGPDE